LPQRNLLGSWHTERLPYQPEALAT
jgi:hypothetical protein